MEPPIKVPPLPVDASHLFYFGECFPAHRDFLTHFSLHTYSPAMESRPGYCCLQLKKQTCWLRTTQKAQAGEQHPAFGLPGQCTV